MKDELINYETAKLAKGKGFDLKSKTNSYYSPEGKLDGLWGDGGYYACTQSLLQRWLREVHGIHIAIEFSNMQNAYFHKVYASTEDLIDIEMKYLTIEPENYIIYATYELALESALFESLNLIP